MNAKVIEELTEEVRKLRHCIEQTLMDRGRLEDPPSTLKVASLVQPSLPAYLDERAVASMVGISISVVRRWRLLGGGPPYRKTGRLVRYSPTDVTQWIEGLPPAVSKKYDPRGVNGGCDAATP